MLEEDGVPGVGGGANAKPKLHRRVIAALTGVAFVAAVIGLVIYVLWGFINPGWNFKVFVDDELPSNFNNTLKIIKDTVYSENTGLVRWTNPIRIMYDGDPDETDLEVLSELCEAYNTIPGFPDITIVEDNANASITFATKENHSRLKADMETTDSSVCRVTTTTYNATQYSYISRADILIEPGGGRGYRNSVILHECFHMLGFMGHTSYSKSIVNDKFPVSGLCGADKLAFMVLYCPGISPGTEYAELEELSGQYTVDQFVQMSEEWLTARAYS